MDRLMNLPIEWGDLALIYGPALWSALAGG
jgi:hypothetical protein